MKASKFTEAQNAFIIKQGDDGATVADICRKAAQDNPVRKSQKMPLRTFRSSARGTPRG